MSYRPFNQGFLPKQATFSDWPYLNPSVQGRSSLQHSHSCPARAGTQGEHQTQPLLPLLASWYHLSFHCLAFRPVGKTEVAGFVLETQVNQLRCESWRSILIGVWTSPVSGTGGCSGITSFLPYSFQLSPSLGTPGGVLYMLTPAKMPRL